jgi:tetratricopeptide (TPR) repeat protein
MIKKSTILALALALALAVATLVAQEKQPAPKSKGEAEALQAVFGTQDADARIKACENLLTKYADTEFKALALYFESVSYQQKNDYEKMVVYAERAIQADPKQYPALLLLAKGIAQRTREFDLDREEKLTKAEKYAKDGMEIAKTAPKPNLQITDQQWEQAKNEYIAQGHEALGFAAMARKNHDVAISELKQALELAPDPVTMVRLAAAYDQAKRPDDALPLLDKVMAMTDVHPSVKQFAQAERVRAMQLKSGSATPAPASTTAPPQVEIKKE